MRKVALFCLMFAGFVCAVDAAAPAQRRGRTAPSAAPAASGSSGAAVSARAAKPATGTVAARAATPAARTNARTTPTAAASTAGSKTVAARAGAMQKVVGTGTKVASAAKNTVVSEECQQKYAGCMDSFCMLDNASGGRCLCSDKNAELNAVLAEIEKLDQQSYQMATTGVERIEMGADADAAIANANAVASSLNRGEDDNKNSRRSLDLSLWDTTLDFEDEDIFGGMSEVSVDDKEGDELYRTVAGLCSAQIPECSGEISMLQLMYAQQIKSDCTAYENSLKQQKNASAQKLAAAEKALRDAALDQLRTSNKYDLGQCVIQFKNCMVTTAGCGDDFANCASVSAMDSTNTRKSTSRKVKNYSIKGAATTIEISASTYDTMMAKKPLCESVTKNCTRVADQVWDAFLREVGPQLKSAELIAEDNARQNCIGSISDCFQKACKDSIDPNDPDGSYDMCLTRPEAMLSLCKVPLNACGISEKNPTAGENGNVWTYVVARLASMRVDSCTREVKECLQSDDRCGKDYTQCIGLDTDTIVRMCPYDKLVGCQQVYGESDIRGDAVYEELANMVQGVMLNIDNSMLTQCQNVVNEAMIKVCGSTEDCNGLVLNEGIGTRSLEYKICEYAGNESNLEIDYARCRTSESQIMDNELGLGGGAIKPFAGVLDGTIYWDGIEFDENGKLTTGDKYFEKIAGVSNTSKTRSSSKTSSLTSISQSQKAGINSELSALQQAIDNAIETVEADPQVQFCLTGRQVQGMTRGGKTEQDKIGREGGRFPQLTKQVRMQIAQAALKVAKENYYNKYDELNANMLSDYAKIGERISEIQGENAKDARREYARVACVNFAESSSMARSAEPPKSAGGKIMAAVAITAAAVAIPFTAGLSGVVVKGAVATIAGSSMTVTGVVASGAVAAGAAGVSAVALSGNKNSANGEYGMTKTTTVDSGDKELVGTKQVNNWNYKETVTSTFEWETLMCRKCTRTQQCDKTKNPLFGNKYCKTWAEPVENCVDIQF